MEYLPTNNEEVINSIFDRLNRNVAKLSNQELRHARFDGKFITAAEEQAEWMFETLGLSFPRIAKSAKRQMKDVEIVANLLLFLEIGPKRLSVDELEQAFAIRDESWEQIDEVVSEFKGVVSLFSEMLSSSCGPPLASSRFRNQGDFYSLFAAIAILKRANEFPGAEVGADRLKAFLDKVDADGDMSGTGTGGPDPVISAYLEAAKSGSHDTSQRATRISITRHVLKGLPLEDWGPKENE